MIASSPLTKFSLPVLKVCFASQILCFLQVAALPSACFGLFLSRWSCFLSSLEPVAVCSHFSVGASQAGYSSAWVDPVVQELLCRVIWLGWLVGATQIPTYRPGFLLGRLGFHRQDSSDLLPEGWGPGCQHRELRGRKVPEALASKTQTLIETLFGVGCCCPPLCLMSPSPDALCCVLFVEYPHPHPHPWLSCPDRLLLTHTCNWSSRLSSSSSAHLQGPCYHHFL